MTGGVETILTADLFLNLGYFRREKLHRRSTFAAHHVMMAAPIELVLVTRHSVRKRNHTRQAALRKQLQGAIDGCKPDFGVFLPNQPEQLIGRKMIACFEEGAQDRIPLFGVLEPNPLQVSIENFLGFAHGFAGGRRMIINPSLEHSLRSERAILA